MNYPDVNFKPNLRVLNNKQIEQIHAATLEVLESTGFRIPHTKALEVLDGAGARVDGDRVRIPSWLVEESIQNQQIRNDNHLHEWISNTFFWIR